MDGPAGAGRAKSRLLPGPTGPFLMPSKLLWFLAGCWLPSSSSCGLPKGPANRVLSSGSPIWLQWPPNLRQSLAQGAGLTPSSQGTWPLRTKYMGGSRGHLISHPASLTISPTHCSLWISLLKGPVSSFIQPRSWGQRLAPSHSHPDLNSTRWVCTFLTYNKPAHCALLQDSPAKSLSETLPPPTPFWWGPSRLAPLSSLPCPQLLPLELQAKTGPGWKGEGSGGVCLHHPARPADSTPRGTLLGGPFSLPMQGNPPSPGESQGSINLGSC